MSEIPGLADKLKTEGDRIASYFEDLTDEQWATEIYTEDAIWTIRNLLAHLVTSERAFVRLFESIRLGGAGVANDFIIDRYNARQQEKTKDMGTLELLEVFKAVRKDMIIWVLGIGESDLERNGRHPFLGLTTLREMIKMVYLHDQIHLRDIKRVLNR
jgi:uncharacterized damage-inducible protein DinB